MHCNMHEKPLTSTLYDKQKKVAITLNKVKARLQRSHKNFMIFYTK